MKASHQSVGTHPSSERWYISDRTGYTVSASPFGLMVMLSVDMKGHGSLSGMLSVFSFV